MSGGLLFWLALLWYLGCDKALAAFLSAAALHELGHILAVRRCGGGVKQLRLSLLGAELVLDGREKLSYGQEVWVASSGPLVNLVTGLAAARLWRWVGGEGLLCFAGASLVLGVFNLLPLSPLDGGQLLRNLLSWRAGPAAGVRWERGVSRGVTVLLLAGGIWLLWRTRYNLSLLVIALWAATSQRKKSGAYSPGTAHRMGQTQRRRRR